MDPLRDNPVRTLSPLARGRAAIAIIFAATAGIAALALADNNYVVVNGILADPDGAPLPNQAVQAYDGRVPLSGGKTTTNEDGEYRLLVPWPAANRLALEVSVPGFDRVRRTIDVTRPDISVPLIRLKLARGIDVVGVVPTQTASANTQHIEMILANTNPTESSSGNGFRIYGTSDAPKNCFDGGGEVQFEVVPLLIAAGLVKTGLEQAHGEMVVKWGVDAQHMQSLTVDIFGDVHYRNCAVTAITLNMAHAFSMNANERKVVWLDLPMTFMLSLGDSGTPTVAPWKISKVGVRTATGVRGEFAVK